MKSLLCPLFSGSSGNSVIVKTSDTTILVDAGKPGKAITEAMLKLGVERPDAILVTHEHSDHTKAVGILSRKHDIPVYATRGTWQGMQGIVGEIKALNIKFIEYNERFSIGDIEVRAFRINHDANEPSGYNFFIGERKITIATDLGCVCEELINNILDSDALLLESNHDVNMLKYGKYPWHLKQRILSDRGHLSNECAGDLLLKVYSTRLKHVILGHLSRENNFPELAYKTVKNILNSGGIDTQNCLDLKVANADEISEAIVI